MFVCMKEILDLINVFSKTISKRPRHEYSVSLEFFIEFLFIQIQKNKFDFKHECFSQESLLDVLEEIIMKELFHIFFKPKTWIDVELELKIEKLSFIDLTKKGLSFEKINSKMIGWCKRQLKKINQTTSPKGKLQCLLFPVKAFLTLKEINTIEKLFPLIILLIIQVKVSNLVLNISYIKQFRRASSLENDKICLLTHFEAAIKFILELDIEN